MRNIKAINNFKHTLLSCVHRITGLLWDFSNGQQNCQQSNGMHMCCKNKASETFTMYREFCVKANLCIDKYGPSNSHPN